MPVTGGRFASVPNSRPIPPEDNYENSEDNFPSRMSPKTAPPALPPKRISARTTANAPSFRTPSSPRPGKSVPPSASTKPAPPSLPTRPGLKRNEEDADTVIPTLNPGNVAKFNKQISHMSGSELFKKRQEAAKTFGNRH